MPEIKTIPLHNGKTFLVVTGLPEGAKDFFLAFINPFLQYRVNDEIKFSDLPAGDYTLIGLLSECGNAAKEFMEYELHNGERFYLDYPGRSIRYTTALESLRSLLTAHGVTDQNTLLLIEK